MRTSLHAESDGTLVLRYQGDATKLVDACAAAAREDRERRDGDKTHKRRRLLSIPREVLYQIALEQGISLDRLAREPALMERVWTLAMGRDYSKFRTLDSSKPYRQSRRSSVVAVKR